MMSARPSPVASPSPVNSAGTLPQTSRFRLIPRVPAKRMVLKAGLPGRLAGSAGGT